MAVPTLVATPGASNANSYATVAEGDAYHAARLYSDAWTDADPDDKTVSLIMATHLLDALFVWFGTVATLTQPLLWPRYFVTGKNGVMIDGHVIPQELKDATCEYARQLIERDRTKDSATETQGLKSFQAGPVAVVFRDGVQAKPLPDAVYYLIQHLGRLLQRGSGSIPLLRA